MAPIASHGLGRSPIGLGYLICRDIMLIVWRAIAKAISRSPAYDKPAERWELHPWTTRSISFCTRGGRDRKGGPGGSAENGRSVSRAFVPPTLSSAFLRPGGEPWQPRLSLRHSAGVPNRRNGRPIRRRRSGRCTKRSSTSSDSPPARVCSTSGVELASRYSWRPVVALGSGRLMRRPPCSRSLDPACPRASSGSGTWPRCPTLRLASTS
jgi:hypothetical protein